MGSRLGLQLECRNAGMQECSQPEMAGSLEEGVMNKKKKKASRDTCVSESYRRESVSGVGGRGSGQLVPSHARQLDSAKLYTS